MTERNAHARKGWRNRDGPNDISRDQEFVDSRGRIRHHYFGEGAYEESERVIQQLLRDAGAKDIGPELVTVDARGAEVAADWDDLQSPERYLGFARTVTGSRAC